MLAGILILGVGMASLESNQAHAEENHDNTPQNVKLVGTYNADQVDSQTMQQFKNIEKEDGSVAKLKLYAHLYKTIKANIVLTVKSFVSINYFSFFSINIT